MIRKNNAAGAMKTLILLRHAKASWDQPEVSDADRALKPKGHRQAEKMSAHLRESLPAPQQVFCSSSRRTRETLPTFQVAWGLEEQQIHFLDELYLADEQRLFDFVRSLPDSQDRVLLLGHNPGLTDLVNLLTDRSTYIKNLRPCGVAVLEVSASGWSDLAPGTCTLAMHLRPKELEE